MRGQKRGDRRGRAGGKASGSGGDNRPQISGEQGKDPAGCGCGLYRGYPGKPGEEGQHKLWLPVLPQTIPLQTIPRYQQEEFTGEWRGFTGEDWSLEAVVGMYDDPENQRQAPVVLNLAENGHYAVCGTVGSGKSTFLQTLVYSLITRYSPQMLHVYGVDFSSHMLGAFEGDAHTGDIIYENQPEKLAASSI